MMKGIKNKKYWLPVVSLLITGAVTSAAVSATKPNDVRSANDKVNANQVLATTDTKPPVEATTSEESVVESDANTATRPQPNSTNSVAQAEQDKKAQCESSQPQQNEELKTEDARHTSQQGWIKRSYYGRTLGTQADYEAALAKEDQIHATNLQLIEAKYSC
jgi:hypothetical protein